MKSFIKNQAKITHHIHRNWFLIPHGLHVYFLDMLDVLLGLCQMFAEAVSWREGDYHLSFIYSQPCIHDWSTCKVGNFTLTAPNHSAVGNNLSKEAETCQPSLVHSLYERVCTQCYSSWLNNCVKVLYGYKENAKIISSLNLKYVSVKLFVGWEH